MVAYSRRRKTETTRNPGCHFKTHVLPLPNHVALRLRLAIEMPHSCCCFLSRARHHTRRRCHLLRYYGHPATIPMLDLTLSFAQVQQSDRTELPSPVPPWFVPDDVDFDTTVVSF